MKKVVLCALAASAVMLCSCEQKNSSQTESQAETTTTKATSLTIASQTAKTTTTTTQSTTTTTSVSTEKTEFTSRDMYHTQQEEMQEIQEFCTFIVKKWAAVYNGEASFDFTPYCKYENLAKYLDYHAHYKDKMFSHLSITQFTVLNYFGGSGTSDIITVDVMLSDSTAGYGAARFVVQSVEGKFVLCDMLWNTEASLDVRFKQEGRGSADYWAGCDYDELIKWIESEAEKTQAGES